MSDVIKNSSSGAKMVRNLLLQVLYSQSVIANSVQPRPVHKEGDEILPTNEGNSSEKFYIAEVLEDKFNLFKLPQNSILSIFKLMTDLRPLRRITCSSAVLASVAKRKARAWGLCQNRPLQPTYARFWIFQPQE